MRVFAPQRDEPERAAHARRPASLSLGLCLRLSAGAERRNQQAAPGLSLSVSRRVFCASLGAGFRGYSDSLRLRKLIHILLFSSGSFRSFSPELEPLPRRAPLRFGVFGCKRGKLASGRLFWPLFRGCLGCGSQI